MRGRAWVLLAHTLLGILLFSVGCGTVGDTPGSSTGVATTVATRDERPAPPESPPPTVGAVQTKGPSPASATPSQVTPTVTQAASRPSKTVTSAIFEGLVRIPEGEFEMGDHHGFVDPQHPSDEGPIHVVHIDSFYISATEATNQQFAEYLNSALAQGSIEVVDGIVYGKGGTETYFTTRQADQYSRIGWDGRTFAVLDNRGNHPVTSVRWFGAVAYANWLSVKNGLAGCYDLATGKCDFSKECFRLPTEAEWEYAARGGLYSPYAIFPWGNDADNAKANWPNSGDPFEAGPYPWTTPVGFYDGALRSKADYNWPASQQTYQTANGVNGFGLYDVAGNVWEYVSDWYGQNYYSTSPRDNPHGPDNGSPAPDGKAYRGMRGGNWYNGENGHSRVANRNPSYYRGPQDPNHPYYHLGFRIALALRQ